MTKKTRPEPEPEPAAVEEAAPRSSPGIGETVLYVLTDADILRREPGGDKTTKAAGAVVPMLVTGESEAGIDGVAFIGQRKLQTCYIVGAREGTAAGMWTWRAA